MRSTFDRILNMSLERSLEEKRQEIAATHLSVEAEAQLREKFPHIPAEHISGVVNRYRDVLAEATVVDYIPILVEKEIRG